MLEHSVNNLNMIDYPLLQNGLNDAVNLINNQLLGCLNELDKNVIRLDNEIKKHTTIGILLKIIVVVSGVVIATGFLINWNWIIQLIGGFISLMTAVERIFGNVDVLLTKVAGRDAYNRIRREVVNIHESMIIKLVQNRDDNPEESARQYIQVQSEIRDKIYKVDNEIKANIESKNYQLLGRLTLEDQ